MVALRGGWVGLCPGGPNAGVNGIWFQRTGDPPDTYVGMSKADLRPTANGGTIATGTGSAAQRRATYITNATAALQAQLGSAYVITVMLPADGTTLDIDNFEVRDA